MDSEDHVVEKLKGKNCQIKFIDGEEMFFYIKKLDDEQSQGEWLAEAERILNSLPNSDDDCLPIPGIAFNHRQIKYIKLI